MAGVLLGLGLVVQGPPALAETLVFGSEGPVVAQLQQRLIKLHFVPGPVTGRYDLATLTAVWAFRKANGLGVSQVVDARTWRALGHPRRIRPLVPQGAANRVEIDLRAQLAEVYRNGRLVLISHVSTGAGRRYCLHGRCSKAITPTGDFKVRKKRGGWHKAPLGYLYKPVYFNGGIALHGSREVPAHPASHGCVRLPLHVADQVHRLVTRGTAVYVR